jgi:two-component system cell cycle response regulator DivK
MPPVRVLCVEDNPQNMRLVRKILSGAGYHVIEAVDGLSGIEAIRSEAPDLVLMDVNLPDLDGLEVTRRIRAEGAWPNLPIIALTANAMHGDKERCIEAGCSGYIPKPITKSELLGTVRHFSPDVQQNSPSQT